MGMPLPCDVAVKNRLPPKTGTDVVITSDGLEEATSGISELTVHAARSVLSNKVTGVNCAFQLMMISEGGATVLITNDAVIVLL